MFCSVLSLVLAVFASLDLFFVCVLVLKIKSFIHSLKELLSRSVMV